MTVPGGGWESMDPWEKIVQWREVAPEIAKEVMQLAKARATQERRSQVAAEKEREEAARFERELARTSEMHEYQLAKDQSEREHRLATDRQRRQYKLANRMWWTQIIGVVGGLLLVGALVVISWRSITSGNLGSAAAVFGMGSTLTAGIYGLNVAMKRSLSTLAGDGDSPMAGKSQGAEDL
jgi:hypothetical protein